jgi:rare lipoprotein A
MADESRALALQLKSGEETPLEAAPRVAVQTESLAPPPGRSAAPTRNRPGKAPPPPAAAPVETAATDAVGLDRQTVEQGAPRATQLFIQAGAFTRFDNANRLSAALSAVGPSVVSQVQIKGAAYFRVRLGPLPSVADADAMLEKVIASGFPDARVVVD